MTEILQAMKERRATKRFDASYKIPEDELRAILEAAKSAPTAFNVQHWRFVVVQDAEQRAKIRAAAWNQPQVEESAALIVLCADFKAWKRDTSRYWAGVPKEMQDKYVGMIQHFYDGNEQLQRDEGIRSCGMAAYAIMLAAAAHGLQTCPMDGFDFKKVGEIINLPEDHEIVMFVAIGKGSEPPPPHGARLPYDEVVLRDRFA
ncbi:NADH/NADPH-flavin oxidoreductase [Neoasaia chiangmaiensis NBRC 101099]|uniref:Reductase DrgA n=1 Tax=Neoasaia chiangmaiensis TaxID=320497 RepID=A0A1U9KNZ1_9PROT|nr:nitroreductase family protein [Neoasaia chiangmaiensis]AQS87518.1 reductase DrgA [Neoasaia chiangmaiensis]GBR42426.1 NADH/NADPH-flavin oxidoreductase [Neoasaia chiangmaiensis NBRC 101099]GEN16315.1 NAD(P)H nitroreductase [Neoasaia chiangmaiensis]